jgi:DNA-directed RNA polymerase subunit RPC12/RpoP
MEAEMPFTGKLLTQVEAFVDKARKGEMMPYPGKVAGKDAIILLDGEFLGMADKMVIMGDLISLRAECKILERVAAAARELEDPPPKLLHALQILHRENIVECPHCGTRGNPFPGEDPVSCGNCGKEFTLEEGHLG